MITREKIESILSSNGVTSNVSDDEIRSILLGARFKDDEVDTAIMVLRENCSSQEGRVSALHKVFRSSEALLPQEISELLGIDVTKDLSVKIADKDHRLPVAHLILIAITAFVVAVLIAAIYMYLFKIGIFHPSLYS